QVKPDDPDLHNALGVLLESQEHFDQAIDHYAEAARRWEKAGSPNHKVAIRNWGDALRGKMLYAEAAEKYRQAIDLDPEDPSSYCSLGLALEGQEQFEEAIRQYQEADERFRKAGSPLRRTALIAWANALRSQERFDEAVTKFSAAVEIDPEDYTALFLYGVGLVGCAQYGDAVAQFQKAERCARAAHLPSHLKATYLFKLGRFQKGWEAWWETRTRCNDALQEGVRDRDEADVAIAFGDILREIFS